MRLMPRSLLGQLALLILVAFVMAQVISVWLFTDERGEAIRAAQRFETADRTAAVARAIEGAPALSRNNILAAANSRLVRFSIDDTPLVASNGIEPAGVRSRILDLLGEPRDLRLEEVVVSPHDRMRTDPPAPMIWLRNRMQAASVAPTELWLSVPLADGGWLNARSRFERPHLRVPPAILGTTLLSLALIMTALWLGLNQITGPLRRLAAAADGFGLNASPSEVPQGGPREARALSDALVRMHARLSGMITDRTQMLAALGHDLRSPITALRVRAEMVDDDETRERMVATLDEMQDMVEATLAFTRGVSTSQPTEAIDLSDVLDDLAQELSEAGPRIAFTPTRPIIGRLRRVPIRRALRNLLENAQRYGAGAQVMLQELDGVIEILIDDNGPGIPSEDIERVFDPFTRLEASRSRETGGIGLGLPIAREILRAHGGDVHLANRPEGGLRTTVTLPAGKDPTA